MNKDVKKASITNIVTNIFLVFNNLIIGLLFSSLSLLTKAFESIFDVLSALVIHYTVKLNNKEPDSNHQFGHSRAENIAGYTIGIIMIIFSLTFIKISIEKIIYHEIIQYSQFMLYATIITLIVKLCLYIYIKNIAYEHNSPALKANAKDHLNDVFIIFGIFIAIMGVKYGYPILDPITGLIISLIIFKSGLDILKENLNYLMGINADEKIIDKIKIKVKETTGVETINKIKTQYLGNKIQIEIHIGVNSKITIEKAHKIGNHVRDSIEKMRDINNCFVHIDPKK